MWSSTLRRAAQQLPLKKQGHRFVAAPPLSNIAEARSWIIKSSERLTDKAYIFRKWCHHITPSFYNIPFGGNRYFCSQTGDDRSVREMYREARQDELAFHFEFLDTEILPNEISDGEWTEAHQKLLVDLSWCRGPLRFVLDKWLEEGNEFDQNGISMITYRLIKRNRYYYLRILQFSEWLEANKQIDLTEKDYALRLHMIAGTKDLFRTEEYMENIPESFKGEIVYRIFIASCVSARNMKKAQEVFDKMSVLKLPRTVAMYNQMIMLYKRLDKQKIADILVLMDKENIEPSLLTFKLLIDHKGESNDIAGMEELYKKMLAKNIQPDIGALLSLAKHFVSAGFKDKAATILKEMENEYLKDPFGAGKAWLRIKSTVEDDDKRLWYECKMDIMLDKIEAATVVWEDYALRN